MAVLRNELEIMPAGSAIVMTNPAFESALPADSYPITSRSTMGFNATSGNVYGGRIVLPSTVDGSTYKWLNFAGYYQGFALLSQIETLENAGFSVFIYDSSGNYRKYIWHGNEYRNTTGSSAGWVQFQAGVQAEYICLDLNRAADSSSGPFDVSDIAGFEFHANFASSSSGSLLGIYQIAISNSVAITGGDSVDPSTFKEVSDNIATVVPRNYRQFLSLTSGYYGQAGTAYSCRRDFDIGNGSTETYLEERGFSFSFFPSIDTGAGATSSTAEGGQPHAVCDPDSRTFRVVQSATDEVRLIDGVFSGFDVENGDYQWECVGSTDGSCLVQGNKFFNARDVRVGHAEFRGTTFIDCDQITVSLNSILASCTISSSAGKGLYIIDGPGDYSDKTISLEDESASVHVTLAEGGAGTYDLTGLSDVGQTVVFHNESATDAITVQVNEDFGATSTTTSGGTITVEVVAPPATASVTNITAGSRLRIVNLTQDVETFNDIVAGTSYSENYTVGTTYATGDVVELYLQQFDGTDAKFGLTASTEANASGWSIRAAQRDDEVYIFNALDGGAVTKFSADYVDGEIDLNSTANFVSQEFYAWWVANLSTEQGIRNFYGGYIAEDAANYRNDVDVVRINWDNLTTTNVRQLDAARIYASDGSYPVKNDGATTGGGGIDVNWKEKVFLATTGSGPLTAPQEARLLACALESKQDTIISDVADVPTVEEIDAELTDSHGAGAWTGSGSGGDDAAAIYTYFTDLTRADAFKADVSSLATSSELASVQAHGDLTWSTATGFSTFDPSNDVVSRVTLVDTVTENTDMRGTDGANTVVPNNALISSISSSVELMRKYHDNDTVFTAADGVTQTTQSLAYFSITFDDDGTTPLKTVSFRNADDQPTLLPNLTGYKKL